MRCMSFRLLGFYVHWFEVLGFYVLIAGVACKFCFLLIVGVHCVFPMVRF